MVPAPRLAKIEREGRLTVIRSSHLVEYEEQLQRWLEKDISILSDDLLVIGRQVETDDRGLIDLLCIDSAGDLVLCELKRGKAPPEIVGQVLAYKDWVENLSRGRIVSLAKDYMPVGLEEAFRQRFRRHLPETLNRNQRVIVVAKEFDLSATKAFQQVANRGINIKMATFWTYRERGGNQYIVLSIRPPKDLIELKLSLTKGVSDGDLGALIDGLLQDREITKKLTIKKIVHAVRANIARLADHVDSERVENNLKDMRGQETHRVKFLDSETVEITRTKEYFRKWGEPGHPIPKAAPEK